MEQLPLKKKVSYLEMNNQETKILDSWMIWRRYSDTEQCSFWRLEEDSLSFGSAQPDVFLMLNGLEAVAFWKSSLP